MPSDPARVIASVMAVVFATLICPASLSAQRLAVYDGGTAFTDSELYMMTNCNDGCSDRKHFQPVADPRGVPALTDGMDRDAKCYEMYFPHCQYGSDNFCMKCMAEPGGQRQFPLGTSVWQAFSIFVPADFLHNPDWLVVYQFHDHPDNVGSCDTWQSPSLAIQLNNPGTQWVFVGRYNAAKCDNGGRSTYAFTRTQGVVKGEWTHFVLHVKFDYSGGGGLRSGRRMGRVPRRARWSITLARWGATMSGCPTTTSRSAATTGTRQAREAPRSTLTA